MTVVPRPGRGVCSALLSAVLLGSMIAVLAACSGSTAPDGTKAAPVRADDTLTLPAGSAQVPAVTGASDLSTKPTIAAGTGTPPATLVTRDLVVGTGAAAARTSTVLVQYVGALWAGGKEFDSSWQSGQPVPFPLDQVIPGFQQGIAGMKVGGRREIVIPPDLGYGPQGGQPPVIAADDTLVFVVDLLGVQAADR